MISPGQWLNSSPVVRALGYRSPFPGLTTKGMLSYNDHKQREPFRSCAAGSLAGQKAFTPQHRHERATVGVDVGNASHAGALHTSIPKIILTSKCQKTKCK